MPLVHSLLVNQVSRPAAWDDFAYARRRYNFNELRPLLRLAGSCGNCVSGLLVFQEYHVLPGNTERSALPHSHSPQEQLG
jgi:hypothetical protein